MASAFVKVLRAASILLCGIVILSTLLFAVNQTSTASGHQQEELAEKTPAHTAAAPAKENGVHKAIDDVAEEVTSPVSGVVSSSSSEWGTHAIRLLFALLVYGFGLGYLARVLKVRT